MRDYRQTSLFDEYVDDELEDNFVEQKDSYSLYQDESAKEGEFEYKVFDIFGVLVAKWTAKADCLSLSTSEYKKSFVRQTFFKIVSQEKEKERKAQAEKAKKEREARQEIAASKAKTPTPIASNTRRAPSYTGYKGYSYYDDIDAGDDFSWYGGYHYQPKPKSTGFLDKLNKSDTLVVHCEDRTTEMLAQIYEGKNWDVLRDGNIDKDELHQLLQSHDRIVCLGHGTGSGLINKQGSGSVIGAEEAPYLKDKKLFIIWCNADAYFTKHNIGQGQFITGNMPSEVWECRAAGCGNISSELMLENITYWSKLCADVAERALNGDAQGAVDYVREHYIKKYGNHPVTIYNAERTKVQGKPLEDLSKEYWGPEELLHPAKPSYSGYSGFSFNASSPLGRTSTASKKVEPELVDDEEDEDTDEDEQPDLTWEELQDLADEVSSLNYKTDPQVNDFDNDPDAMADHISEVEDLLYTEVDTDDIDYWMDYESHGKVGIKVYMKDTEVFTFALTDGKLLPW